MTSHPPKLYWIGFNLVKGSGVVRFRYLLDLQEMLEVLDL